MKRIIGWCIAALLAATPAAHAQQTRIFHTDNYCQITSVAVATKITTANCSTGRASTSPVIAEICVSTAPVRYTSDGITTPTSSVGVPVAAGACFPFAGPILQMQFIAVSGSPVLDIEELE
jgi:hypothetical protein